jgi:recombinational DNA repair protein (RecF pathway)
MNGCTSRRGFLTLSTCGVPAARACSTCGQPTCPIHLSPQSGFSQCLSCAAADPSVQEGEHDGVWSSRYRDSYYGSGYSAMSTDRSYDDQDVSAFDETQTDDLADDDAGPGGFADS